MKPFDLEAAKRGEPICTRDGREAKFIAHVPEARLSNQVVCLHGVQILTHFGDGISPSHIGDSSLDLFMAPKKRTVWVNLYDHGTAHSYASKDEADKRYLTRIGGKAYPLEVEE